jgi:hypothetical protein
MERIKIAITVQHNFIHCAHSDVKNAQNAHYIFRPYLGHPQVCAIENTKYRYTSCLSYDIMSHLTDVGVKMLLANISLKLNNKKMEYVY